MPMSEQPPVRPPNEPSNQPTTPMPAAAPAGPPTVPPAGPPTVPPAGPRRNLWQRTTSTNGGRWGLAIAAAALVALMVAGFALAGLLLLRANDRVGMMGYREDGRYLHEDGSGDGRRPMHDEKMERRKDKQNDRQGTEEMPGMQGMQGMPGGRGQGMGGLGNLVDGMPLHGEVTTTANGAVQALLFQRGEVTAVSDTSITLKSSDGFEGTYGRTTTTVSKGIVPEKGGQAFVVARKSDKVAVTTVAVKVGDDTAPGS